MTIAAQLSPEAEEEVTGIVRHDLIEGLGNEIAFKTIRIVPGEDLDGEPYHHIVVVYSGDSEFLDPAWLNGFKRRNWKRLAKWGIHVTTESYVDEVEDAEWSKAEQTDPSKRDDG